MSLWCLAVDAWSEGLVWFADKDESHCGPSKRATRLSFKLVKITEPLRNFFFLFLSQWLTAWSLSAFCSLCVFWAFDQMVWGKCICGTEYNRKIFISAISQRHSDCCFGKRLHCQIGRKEDSVLNLSGYNRWDTQGFKQRFILSALLIILTVHQMINLGENTEAVLFQMVKVLKNVLH